MIISSKDEKYYQMTKLTFGESIGPYNNRSTKSLQNNCSHNTVNHRKLESYRKYVRTTRAIT